MLEINYEEGVERAARVVLWLSLSAYDSIGMSIAASGAFNSAAIIEVISVCWYKCILICIAIGISCLQMRTLTDCRCSLECCLARSRKGLFESDDVL
jgi:hypothetical protein